MANPRPSGPRTYLSVHRMLALLVLPAIFFLTRPVMAATVCDRAGCGTIRQGQTVVCFTPATPAPSTLWSQGQLQPADTGALPRERDTTDFNEVTTNYGARNWFYGVDIQNGYILMGLSHGIGIWDARTDPANPALVAAKRYPADAGFPYLPSGEQSKIVFGGISAPDDSVAAIVGYSGAGILVFDLSDKTKPRPVYQNIDKTSESVYTAKINGTRYAFMAAPTPGGLYVYNLDKALTFNGCLEDNSTAGNCPGVLVSKVQTTTSAASFVHGAGNYVVVSFGGTGGFQIFDMSDPLHPVSKLIGLRSQPVQGVALWNQGSSYYLGARQGATLTNRQPTTAIYDVSCITGANGCTGLGSPLANMNTDTQSGGEYLTFSRAGSTPFLYVGGDAYCIGADGLQHEWLFDVSNPSNPTDVTPVQTTQVTAPYNGVNVTRTVDYWAYYYRPNPTGFNLVAPRAGKFNGNYFYRAARSIFDIHKLTRDVPPSANFTVSPAEIYPGTAVTFNDTSTGSPTNWQWTFGGGTPASSTLQSPVATFATEGSKSVSLTASNSQGPSAVTKSIVVLSPVPQIGAITVSPANPLVCQPVTLTATGVTGQPTLAYGWTLNGSPVAGAATSTFNWSTTGLQSGLYTAAVTVTNGAGTATKNVSVNLGALQTLAFTGANGAPTNDAFTAGTVKFHAGGQGATEWNWDFGDGQGFRGWTSDPVTGPDPTVSYTATGAKAVKVKIRNCVQGGEGITSAALTVNITQTTPLSADFEAALFSQFSQYFATVGVPIVFNDHSQGAEKWYYDWNHTSTNEANCNFNADPGNSLPVATHTYTVLGNYNPCLKVTRGGGAEQSVTVHGTINVGSAGGGGGGGGNTPSITVNGVGAGQINQPIPFAASASNCTPSSTWSWSVGGGTISGSATGSGISVTWATTGQKTVSATNSGCSGALGSRSVTITDPNGGGGGGGGTGGGTLQAQFNITPASPQPGESASFDASPSTGSPTDYSWSFGDGSATVTGKTATHSYTAAGSYVVQLSVSKAATGCPFAPCVAESKVTKTVVVGTPPPPPVSAEYTASVSCLNVGGFDQCQAETAKAVTLTATATDATTYQWDFGDGSTGTGRTVTHTWAAPNSYSVTLTTIKSPSTTASTKSRTFVVSGTPPPPPPVAKSVVLPWIAQTRGALVQSSDLYVHNPGVGAMNVQLEFRKRGLPESNPPRVSKTIAPGATLYVADVLGELFNRENVAGFVSLVVDQGNAEPIITSYNTTVQDGKQFGQTISGISMSSTGSAVGSEPVTPFQNLVGLISNSDRLAYFGVSNPGQAATTFHLRFYDKTGKLIGESGQDFTVAPFGQRQFQSAEIQSSFGISNEVDYRVEVETKAGGTLFPYASNLRLASNDPSFMEAGSSKNQKAYLLGVLSAPGPNNSIWRSDLLLSNIGSKVSTADVTFTGLGTSAATTAPFHVTLQPGETRRLENVVGGQLAVANGIGVLTVSGGSTDGIFPIVQGESYDNAIPTKRFGQAMAPFTDASVAGTGQSHYMVGLRQDATHRTTFWLFNPGTTTAQYDIVYRGLDGTVIGTIPGVLLGAGRLRQFSPNQHALPAAGAQNGFTVQIVVKGGKVLSAAQVVNNGTNDPSYIQGEVR
ncbi:MAG TPA: PKD domain-containing protein [Thermoanaerobaculia bacterium]|nr:PKD domain-containing protein [Thermoanaerobaculia bacterium]